MESSEQVAWGMYAQLEPRDRQVVDAWRSLGNDLVTSLLNSGVLSREKPGDDLADWSRRRLGTDPEFVLRRTAEHEAAHAVVARALGLKVIDVSIDEGGRDGRTRYESVSRATTAAVAAAAEVWITEFRALAYPGGDADGCRDDMQVLVRNTDGDYDVFAACRCARTILEARRDEVLALAQRLVDTRRVTFEG